MAGQKKRETAPYPFTEAFERAVVALVCTSAKFFGLLGRDLDAEAMPSDTGRLALEAAQAIAKDSGHGPGSALVVLQRLRRWMDEGHVTAGELVAVDDMIAEAEDAGLPDPETVVVELAPLLKRRMQSTAIKTAMDDYGKRRDLDGVVSLLIRANGLGRVDTDIGVKVGTAGFDAIAALRQLEKLPTGVTELDSALQGGLGRGLLGAFIGGPGAGKSIALSHQAAFAACGGLFVAVATMELPEAMVLARIQANITGETIDAVVAGRPRVREKLEAKPPQGPCIVKEFAPQVTTVEDLIAWVEQCEQVEGRGVDVLVVDYADKLTASTDEKGQYQTQLKVWEGLRYYVHERRIWGWTASQASRGDKKRKVVDLDHVSDSMHKVRVVDLAITLNLDDDNELTFFVAKNRVGRSRLSVGPIPTDFAVGAIAPVVHVDGAVDLLADEVSFSLLDET